MVTMGSLLHQQNDYYFKDLMEVVEKLLAYKMPGI